MLCRGMCATVCCFLNKFLGLSKLHLIFLKIQPGLCSSGGGMSTLELSSYVLEIPNYAYTTLSQNLIG